MDNEPILLDIKDRIATITLNRPQVRNAFDETMIEALSAAFYKLSEKKDVISVVLKGDSKAFSAGADLNWMKRAANYTPEENKQDALNLARMLEKLNTLPQTTIACVQGTAMGGGFGLVCCCDMVIADEKAVFSLSEVKLGLIPATIGPYVIAAIGQRQARRFFQTGERFDGKEAYHIGLVHKLTSRPEDMDYQLHLVLGDLQKNGPMAMRKSKELCLNLVQKNVTPEIIAYTAQLIADVRATDEAQEGLNAFLEKRKAAWIEG